MKKLLSIMFMTAAIAFGSAQVMAQETQTASPLKKGGPQHEKMKQKFEQRLNLTEKQKEKAKKIHEKGAKQMKPVMEKSMALRKEIGEIKKSDLDESAKKEKIEAKFKELRELHKKAKEIRKQNGEDFEKILTKDQKEELTKMKAEGRKKFERKHPPRPPFGMFGPDNEGEKGIFPPPPPPQEEK
ncbi:Spy/CpxP family protein refolding chaperone [bacterium]|nr:Spy/CpxP family protein refolding chaperone [bacterium]